jgi:transposase
MLKVADYEQIRKAVLVREMSQRAVAREFKHGRDTVKKALEHPSPPGYRRGKPAASPLMDPVKSIVDGWLEDERERGVPRKQRSNAKEVWKRLCREHGFKGSVYIVRRYVRKRPAAAGGEAFFPLDFRPGEEAQVDWGVGWVMLASVLVKVHLFCLRLCYSRGMYVRAYLSERMECFLDGHVRAFRFFGGVPKRNAYDNLKTAVIWTGRVENGVKLVQSSFLAGMPSFADLEALNAHLESCCLEDLERLAPHSEKTRKVLLEEERAHLLPLRHGDFAACSTQSTFASKLALVQHETNFYSVPVRCAHHAVVLRAFADRIELWHGEGCIAAHERSWERHRYVLEYTHYLPLLATKPGGLQNARPFRGMPWGEDFDLLRRELAFRYGDEGTRKFIRVLLLFTTHPEEQVKAAVRECVRRRAFSDEAVQSVLAYRPPAQGKTLDLSAHPLFHLEGDGVRAAAEYDALLLEQEVRA